MAQGIIISGIVVCFAQIGIEYHVNQAVRIFDIVLLILLILAFWFG